MPYIPPGPSGMPVGYTGPYTPGYTAPAAPPPPAAPAAGGEMPGPVDIEPGMWVQIEEERLVLEKYIADLSAELARETNATARAEIANRLRIAQMDYDQKQRETELALATSPIDFVAYEMYKRQVQQASLEGRPSPSPSDTIRRMEEDLVRRGGGEMQPWGPKGGGIGPPPPGFPGDMDWVPDVAPEDWHGIPYGPVEGGGGHYEPRGGGQEAWSPSGPVGTVHTDAEINAMLAEMTGVEQGRYQGALGAAVPRSQQFSRSGFADMSEDERAVLASFLRAGVRWGKQETSIDPTEYYTEMEEGFVPTMRDIGPTGYKF